MAGACAAVPPALAATRVHGATLHGAQITACEPAGRQARGWVGGAACGGGAVAGRWPEPGRRQPARCGWERSTSQQRADETVCERRGVRWCLCWLVVAMRVAPACMGLRARRQPVRRCTQAECARSPVTNFQAGPCCAVRRRGPRLSQRGSLRSGGTHRPRLARLFLSTCQRVAGRRRFGLRCTVAGAIERPWRTCSMSIASDKQGACCLLGAACLWRARGVVRLGSGRSPHLRCAHLGASSLSPPVALL